LIMKKFSAGLLCVRHHHVFGLRWEAFAKK
jgi:hypothetical protein